MQLAPVKSLLRDVLGLGTPAHAPTHESALPCCITALDSMAVVQRLAALEERYGFVINDDDISAQSFATVGSLAAFVTDKKAA